MGAPSYRVARLTSADRERAKALFKLMARVFEEELEDVEDGYVDQLLARREFWAIAAFAGDEIVGGITAHELPMTRAHSSELFIYDVAVRPDHQRRGVGRMMMEALLRESRGSGIQGAFVAADNADAHAIEFYRSVGGTPSPVTFFGFEVES